MPHPAGSENAKQMLAELLGSWPPGYDSILAVDPRFLEAYASLAAVPLRRTHLDEKTRHLVALAVNAAVTHLHAEGTLASIDAALAAGASREELLEVIQLTTTLGVHAIAAGVPLLREVVTARGEDLAKQATPRQAEIRRDFRARRGYWSDSWEDLLHIDPDLVAAYLEYSALPWETGPLAPKVKEFVYIAIDASTTHLFLPGLRQHFENAIDHGANADEILQVLEITSLIGMQSAALAAPLIQSRTSEEGLPD